ncbi:MAG: hypothetical protein LM601_08620 [Candidatus Verstraetearchaeota archaeon]|nr:hypothetical protein [Candidatus Verstraetearchaeota archaeon]
MVHVYNIHNKIKILSDLELELNYFSTNNATGPFDLNIRVVGGILMDLSRLERFCQNYFGLENRHFVLRRIREYPFRSEILLKDLLGETLLAITKHYYMTRYVLDFSPAVLGSSLIQQILRIKMLLKGLSLLHCACISHKESNTGILLSAYPDIGKTTTTLLAVKSGLFEYLSDDEIIVDQNHVAWAFPKVFNIRNLKYTGFRIKSTFRKKLSSSMLSLVPWPLNIYLSRIEHVDVGNVIPIKEHAPIKYIFILESGQNLCKLLSKEECIRKLWLNNKRQYSCIPELLNIYAYFNADFDLEELINKEKKLISDLAFQSECFLIKAKNAKDFINTLIKMFE